MKRHLAVSQEEVESRYGELYPEIEALHQEDVKWISTIIDGFIELDRQLAQYRDSHGSEDVKAESYIAFESFSTLQRKYIEMRIGELIHEKEQMDDKILEDESLSLFQRNNKTEIIEQNRRASRILRGRLELMDLRVQHFLKGVNGK